MFNFVSRKKLVKVRALLEGRMNRTFARQLEDGNRRGVRGALCEVAFVVPYKGGRNPNFAAARPVLTRDMSWAGMSILDESLIDADTVMVALGNAGDFKFLHCLVEHESHLGYGRFQIGLQPTELVTLCGGDLDAFLERLTELEAEVESANAV